MAFVVVFPYIGVVKYRLYRPEDFAQLYAIEEACFDDPLRFSRRYMRQLIQSAQSATWIAEEDDVMAGFAIVAWLVEAGSTTAYIETIEVSPKYRRRGIGFELLNRMEAAAINAGAVQIWLHVDQRNDSAIHLYRARGYELRGQEADFYAPGLGAEIYIKRL